MQTEGPTTPIARDDRSVVTVGTYDGVHLGHQAILRYLRARAAAVRGKTTVVSFDPHPREVVLGEHVPLLTTLDERAALLAEQGVERFVVLPFTRDLSMLSAEDYVRDVLIGTVGLREIVIGYDHAFGRNRSGNRQTLEAMGAEHGFTVDVIPAQAVADATVSSTRVRMQLAEEGDVAGAAALLGRPYSLSGTVVRGDQRGRTIGYPTANLQVHGDRKLVPREGVYAVRIAHRGGTAGAMLNVGRRPTFERDGAVSVEAHLFDFAEDLYGQALHVEFLARIRDERRFDGPAALAEQLRQDEMESRQVLRPQAS
jgi:riboflavin kinase / FMN adenylyltransferase